MPSRKEQIHAAIYNAAVDAGFMLYATLPAQAIGKCRIMAKDLLEDTPHFEVTFTGKDISDIDVEIEGVGLVEAFNNKIKNA